VSSAAGEPPFPVEPVERGPHALSDSKKNKDRTVLYSTVRAPESSLQSSRRILFTKELTNLNNLNNYLDREYSKKRDYQINIHVSEDGYKMYHSLDRERKRLVKKIVMEVIKKLQDIKLDAVVSNVNLNLDLDIDAQIIKVERAGVKELKQQLKKYESIVSCVKAVVNGNFSNKLELIKKCLQQ
jgi:hypothetical protein